MVFHITGIFAQCLCTLIDILCCRSYFILPTLDIRNGFASVILLLPDGLLPCCNAFNGICNLPGRFIVRIRSCPSAIPGIRCCRFWGYGFYLFVMPPNFSMDSLAFSDHCASSSCRFITLLSAPMSSRKKCFPGFPRMTSIPLRDVLRQNK